MTGGPYIAKMTIELNVKSSVRPISMIIAYTLKSMLMNMYIKIQQLLRHCSPALDYIRTYTLCAGTQKKSGSKKIPLGIGTINKPNGSGD